MRPGARRCYCCDRLVHALGLPLAPLAAACTYRVGDQAHRWLRAYKDAPSAALRDVTARALAERFGAWLAWAGEDLAERFGGRWAAVATVPSTRPGRCGAPVDALVGAVPALAGLPRVRLVRGPAAAGHLVADARAFVPAPGERRPDGPVLVVDDTVTTGARAQSAVACLRAGGWRVTGAVAVGRALAPEAGPWVAAYWRERRGWQRARGAAGTTGG